MQKKGEGGKEGLANRGFLKLMSKRGRGDKKGEREKKGEGREEGVTINSHCEEGERRA
jgi:hypothetical protein